ncbi:hypothetical protein V2J09_018580 [Rumex salicifolius]
MPALYISTNLNLEGVDLDPIFAQTTQSLASIIGRPADKVMVIVKGSVELSFGGSKDPGAFAELLSMGGIDKAVKKKLISTVGSILHDHLSIPPSRFFCNVVDLNLSRPKL